MDKFRKIFNNNKEAGLYKSYIKQFAGFTNSYTSKGFIDQGLIDQSIQSLKWNTDNFKRCVPSNEFGYNIIPQTLQIYKTQYIRDFQLEYNGFDEVTAYVRVLTLLGINGIYIDSYDLKDSNIVTFSKKIMLKNITNESLDDLIKICNAYKFYDKLNQYNPKFEEFERYDLDIFLTIFPELQTLIDMNISYDINKSYNRIYNNYKASTIVDKSTMEFLNISVAKAYNVLMSENNITYASLKDIISKIKELESKKSNTPIDDSEILVINGVGIDCSILDINCVNKIIAVLHS